VNALPERKTPTKEQSLAAFTNSRSSKRGLQHGGNKDSRLRPWIAPGIRKLCREFGAGKAIPHVLAGVESVLFLSRPELETGEAREKGMEGKIPALVIAVWFFVMTRLAGEETNGEEYAENRKRALRILHGLKEDEGIVEKIGEKEESWVDWEKVSKKDVDAWLVEVGSNGWIEMDWFLNIDKGSGIGGAEAEIEGERENELDIEAEERERRAKRVRRNRGTMIQDNVDYLSEAKRKEYAAWKAEILATIDNLIRDGVMDDKMDIDEI
jgi:origin recognition complex subunit 6